MRHSAKYLIHADIRTSGVVERSDVVGAIFGQTEGLLGDELDLRDLQESSKIGRIDVAIDSEDGRSFGTVTIASGLDRVRTAVLAAALETIERVGPCRAECTVTEIEDARAAKRRELVDRATDLLADLEESTMTSENLVDAVRQRARVADITEYEGLPAGPRVTDSDAIIVVEGRADVRRLLRFGVKNAVAVEGTDIPDAVARLSTDRTTTALLDGDRGGDLILRELAQVGDVDYVAFAPRGKSIEDLDRAAIMSALRKKVPYEQALDAESPREAFEPTPSPEGSPPAYEDDGSTPPEHIDGDSAPQSSDAGSVGGDDPSGSSAVDTGTGGAQDRQSSTPGADGADAPSSPPSASDGGLAESEVGSAQNTATGPVEPSATSGAEPEPEEAGDSEAGEPDSGDAAAPGAVEEESTAERPGPRTLQDHVEEVIGEGSGQVRFLDASFEPTFEGDADEAFDAVADASDPPRTVVLDCSLSQRLLDVAAQRGVGQVVAANTGEFVKQPTNVRVLTAAELQ